MRPRSDGRAVLGEGRWPSIALVAKRKKLIGGIVVAGLVVAALAIYFLFFRDTAPASVDSVAAAEARQEAIAESTANDTAEDADGGTATDVEPTVDEGETELDSGQPDSNASVGAATDGVWTVDTSIGTFDGSCLSEVCSSTFAGFRINEELASIGAKTVVGRTPGVSGAPGIGWYAGHRSRVRC